MPGLFQDRKLFVVSLLGDVDPVSHGGGYVLIVRPGRIHKHDPQEEDYPQIEYVEWDSDAEDALGTFYQVDLRDLNVWDGLLSWVNDQDRIQILQSVGSEKTVGWDTGRGTLAQRASVVQMVGDYFGWLNLDAYPQRVTRVELAERWAQLSNAGHLAAKFAS